MRTRRHRHHAVGRLLVVAALMATGCAQKFAVDETVTAGDRVTLKLYRIGLSTDEFNAYLKVENRGETAVTLDTGEAACGRGGRRGRPAGGRVFTIKAGKTKTVKLTCRGAFATVTGPFTVAVGPYADAETAAEVAPKAKLTASVGRADRLAVAELAELRERQAPPATEPRESVQMEAPTVGFLGSLRFTDIGLVGEWPKADGTYYVLGARAGILGDGQANSQTPGTAGNFRTLRLGLRYYQPADSRLTFAGGLGWRDLSLPFGENVDTATYSGFQQDAAIRVTSFGLWFSLGWRWPLQRGNQLTLDLLEVYLPVQTLRRDVDVTNAGSYEAAHKTASQIAGAVSGNAPRVAIGVTFAP